MLQDAGRGQGSTPGQHSEEGPAPSEATLAAWSIGAGPPAAAAPAEDSLAQGASIAAQESVGENSLAPAPDLGDAVNSPGARRAQFIRHDQACVLETGRQVLVTAPAGPGPAEPSAGAAELDPEGGTAYQQVIRT